MGFPAHRDQRIDPRRRAGLHVGFGEIPFVGQQHTGLAPRPLPDVSGKTLICSGMG